MRDQHRIDLGSGIQLGDAGLPRSPQAFLETARTLVRLFEAGLDRRSEIGGWHGTSLEAIELTLIKGAFPGAAVAHGNAATGHIFFFPPHQNDFDPRTNVQLQKCGRGGAMQYAQMNAQTAFVMRELGLDFSDHLLQDGIRTLISHSTGFEHHAEEAYVRAEHYVPERARINACLKESSARRGVLVALSNEELKTVEVTDGDIPGEDLKIFAPHGLALPMIVGLEPIGEAELNYFETLQALVATLSQKDNSLAS